MFVISLKDQRSEMSTWLTYYSSLPRGEHKYPVAKHGVTSLYFRAKYRKRNSKTKEMEIQAYAAIIADAFVHCGLFM